MRPSFLELLRSLHDGGVEFVLVGGVAALVEGAPITTLDLDIVYRTTPENIARFAGVLDSLEARYRDPGGRTIRPTQETLAANRINLMVTSAGLLDAMQHIGESWGYEEVAQRSVRRSLDSIVVPVLELSAVIESKIAANRDKDRAMLPVLRATLEELNRRGP